MGDSGQLEETLAQARRSLSCWIKEGLYWMGPRRTRMVWMGGSETKA